LIIQHRILMYIGLISMYGLWNDIIVNDILNLMFQSRRIISIVACSLMEMAIHVYVPVLWEWVRLHVVEYLRQRCAPWVKISFGFKSFFRWI
jgi:hypothetical protein